ncbi:CesT family type III secretion system chaperone [Ramlibacter albus]|uniref:CesT family type III secretion system chaperone n=1 Tax=Ramlibacter albus TaxID=2079448 RepID=A0A923S3C4_9BURK|nr:CesT family type III secretion system chaperone [Ramlibacter albus]MBC5766295.1 CesT family type III secretion system chaperone [Ramlibacter albus]
MAVASLEELCAGLCEILGVPPPRLGIDEHGRVAFHVVLRGVTVNLVHCPQSEPEHVFVLFDMGPVGSEGPSAIGELQALLASNYQLLSTHAPVVSRNPETGDAVLQYVYPLFRATSSGVHALIDAGVDWVSNWRVQSEEPSSSCEAAPGDVPLAMLNLA